MRALIQVAGVIDGEEAAMLLEEGVDWLGFPFRLPVHKEDLSEEDAAAIIGSLPASARGVLITYLREAHRILELCERLGTTTVQLHGELPEDEVAALKTSRPGIYVVKSLVVRGDNRGVLREQMNRFAPHVDAFITDTYDPQTGACGATGRTHDWNISREIVENAGRPVMLAGGLHPANVRDAILRVGPAGVDVHTGVEGPDGRKERGLVQQFVAEAREAFSRLQGPGGPGIS